MDITEIIQSVNTDGTYNQGHPNWDNFAELFGTWFDYDYDKFTDKLKAYFFAKWICTDTVVGGRVYYLDGEAVAVSWQSCRKGDEEIEFLTSEAADSVRELMLDCRTEDECGDPEVPLVNTEEDLGNGYTVSYGSQLLRTDCIHKPTGKAAEVIETYRGMDEIDRWGVVVIQFDDSTTQTVPMKDLLFSFGR